MKLITNFIKTKQQVISPPSPIRSLQPRTTPSSRSNPRNPGHHGDVQDIVVTDSHPGDSEETNPPPNYSEAKNYSDGSSTPPPPEYDFIMRNFQSANRNSMWLFFVFDFHFSIIFSTKIYVHLFILFYPTSLKNFNVNSMYAFLA